MYSLANASGYCLCEPAHVGSLGWLLRALLLWDVVTEKVTWLRLAGAPPLGITGTEPLGDGLGQVLCLGFAVGVQPAWVRHSVLGPVFRSLTRDP